MGVKCVMLGWQFLTQQPLSKNDKCNFKIGSASGRTADTFSSECCCLWITQPKFSNSKCKHMRLHVKFLKSIACRFGFLFFLFIAECWSALGLSVQWCDLLYLLSHHWWPYLVIWLEMESMLWLHIPTYNPDIYPELQTLMYIYSIFYLAYYFIVFTLHHAFYQTVYMY